MQLDPPKSTNHKTQFSTSDLPHISIGTPPFNKLVTSHSNESYTTSPFTDKSWILASAFHRYIRYFVTTILTLAALTSIVLLFVGMLRDIRQCLTAGCILGLACFGVMLHLCLSHRSVPSTSTPLVLSAACMYPVGSLPLATNVDSTAAAVATAALIPRPFDRPPSVLPSSMELTLYNHLNKRSPRPILIDHWQEIPTTPNSYRRYHSDSVAFARNHSVFSCPDDFNKPKHQDLPMEYRRQYSFPTQSHKICITKPIKHVYVNDPFGPLQANNPPFSPAMTTEDTSVHAGVIPCSAVEENKENKQFLFQQAVERGVQGTNLPDAANKVQHPETSPPPVPNRNHLVHRELDHVYLPSVWSGRTGNSSRMPQNLLALLSNSGVDDPGRRYDREREGIFGSRTWRGWCSWFDP